MTLTLRPVFHSSTNLGDTVNRQRTVHIDDETWEAVLAYAAHTGENASAVVRDGLRAYLTGRGYVFVTEPRRYNRRGEGRA